MKNLVGSILLCAAGLSADTADIVFFRGIMSPLNEVPPASLPGGAAATLITHIVRDPDGKIASASMDFVVGYGIAAPVNFTGLHVHRGAAGVNGPIVIRTALGSPAPTPSDPSGFGFFNLQGQILPTDQAGLDALNGMLANPEDYYVNIHTSDFPGGAARAQLNRATFIVPIAQMVPAKVVPAISGSSASATAQFVILTARDARGGITSTQLIFDANLDFGRQTTVTGLKVHSGVAGVNGPAVLDSGIGEGPFSVQTDASGKGNFRRFVEVDMTNPAQVAAVAGLITRTRDYYMQMSTSDSPASLRDQVNNTDLIRLRMTMTPPGSTANPPTSSAITLLLLRTLRGEDGTALAASMMYISNFRFPAGKRDFTSLTIHDGAAGATSPKRLDANLAAIGGVQTETGFGNIFSFATISDPAGMATVNSMMQNPERHYVAIGTGADAAVAVRAQILEPNTALPVVAGAGSAANGTAAAPGGLISIYGTNLAKVTSDPFDSRPLFTPGLTGWFGKTLPTTYDGTKVTIAGKNVPLLSVSPGQINAQVPFDVPAGTQPIVVTNANGAGAAANLTIAAPGPAIFSFPSDLSRGIVVHQDSSLVNAESPARAGETLTVYATGLGQATPALSTGTLVVFPPQSDTATVNATIGGRTAAVVSSVATPFAVGLYQVAVTVPEGLTAGTVPVVIRVGQAASAPVSIEVQ